MKIQIKKKAKKYLDGLDKNSQISIKANLKELSSNPHSRKLDIKKLKERPGKIHAFRLRVGNFRIVYSIYDESLWITRIFHRGRGY